jgi:ubiquinone/menaquinone biosynthesis C-methylase UbiE
LGLAATLWPFGDKSRRSVPLKRRLHAWWEGYDVEAMPRRATAAAAAHDAPPAHGAEDFDSVFEAEKKQAAEWSPVRMKVVQDLWTPGFIVPGGAEYVEELINGCGLSAAETMLEIGVGLGGGTRAIIGRFGNYVTGYERDSALASEARKQAITHNLDSKLEVISAEPEKLKLKKKYFRAALIRDVLFTVEKKEALLEKIVKSLKEGQAQMVITDLMFDGKTEAPELKRWLSAEPQPVYAWSLERLRAALGKLNLVVRTADDESSRYRRMVIRAWQEYLDRIDGESLTAAVGSQVVHEAEFWARRLAAIDAGVLQYVHVVAVKSG